MVSAIDVDGMVSAIDVVANENPSLKETKQLILAPSLRDSLIRPRHLLSHP